MSPEQLICWCAAHNIWLTRTQSNVSATAYDVAGRAITHCVHSEWRQKIPSQEEDLDRAIKVCDMIADELLILKPSIAFKLNAERIHGGAGLSNQSETHTPLDGASCLSSYELR